MKILERLKTRHLLTSSAVDSLAKTSALLEKAQELRAAGLDYGDTCTELSEMSDPRPRTIGELIKEHEGVRGIQLSTDEHGNVQAAYIRGKHGGMKLVSMGDGLENVSSKIWEEKVWRH